MSAQHLRLVALDGAQIAPAPRRRRSKDEALKQDREIILMIIKEHMGHITHSVNRIRALSAELEVSLGIALPDYEPHPLPDLPA